jgi:hypothetical protein
MRRLVWFAIVVLAGFAVACADDKYSPFPFKEFPGYSPPGSKAPADPRRTPNGFVP